MGITSYAFLLSRIKALCWLLSNGCKQLFYVFYPPLICIYNNRVSPIPEKIRLFSLGISLLASSLLVSEHLAPCMHPLITSRCLMRRLHTYFGAHVFCDCLGRLLLQFLSSLPMRLPQVLGHHFFLASKAHIKYKQMLL